MEKISYKGLTGHWTKYGGVRISAVLHQYERKENWYCQLCGEEEPFCLPPYKVKVSDIEEYINVCPICFASCEPVLHREYDGDNEKL